MNPRICIVCFQKLLPRYIKTPRARPHYDHVCNVAGFYGRTWHVDPWRVFLAFVSPICVDVTQGQFSLIISITSKNNTQRGAKQNCIKFFEYLYRLGKNYYSEARCTILSL
jgi:hypothetical protein